MKTVKRRIAVFIIILLMGVGILPTGVWGGSGPPITSGRTAYGIVAMNGDSPIYPKRENLIFDVPAVDGDAVPNATVTAKYDFYNPSDKSESISLAFPVGWYKNIAKNPSKYTDRYTITVNSAPVELKTRHVYSEDFSLDSASFLRDETAAVGLCAPATTVNEYTFLLTGATKECYVTLSAYGFDNVRKIIMEPSASYSEKDKTISISISEGGDYTFKLLCVGDKLLSTNLRATISESPPYIKDAPKTDGTVTLIGEEKYTLNDLVMRNYKEEYGISETDWYNAATDYIQAKKIPKLGIAADIRSQLMTWYQYDIAANAGETVENQVITSAVPDVHEGYEPEKYDYYFHRMTSNKWSGYEECTVEMKTPYLVIDIRHAENLQATENGYTASFSPFTGCVRFMLCETDEPEEVGDDIPPIYVVIFISFCIVALSIIALPILIIVFIIVAIVKRIRRKKKKE